MMDVSQFELNPEVAALVAEETVFDRTKVERTYTVKITNEAGDSKEVEMTFDPCDIYDAPTGSTLRGLARDLDNLSL